MLGLLLCSLVPLSVPRCRVRYETADGLRVLDGVRHGELLRTALLRRGVSPHNGRSRLINCRGLGTCGTCAVQVVEGSVEPATRTEVEKLRLGLPPHGRPPNPALRLACQCSVAGDLLLRKGAGFWGSKAELGPAAEATSYFGELEYVLDTQSPPPEPCVVCDGTEVVPCDLCQGSGMRAGTGVGEGMGAESQCPACKGSGQVVCRSCFKGDPFDLEAVRARAKQRPD